MRNKSQGHISLVPIYLSNQDGRSNMNPCYCRSLPGQCFAWNWTLPATWPHRHTLTYTHAAPPTTTTCRSFCFVHFTWESTNILRWHICPGKYNKFQHMSHRHRPLADSHIPSKLNKPLKRELLFYLYLFPLPWWAESQLILTHLSFFPPGAPQ